MPSAIYLVTVGRIVLLRIRGFGKDVGSCFLRISHLMSNVLCLRYKPSAIYWVTVGRIVLLRICGFGKQVAS